jgi:hypothetical protein
VLGEQELGQAAGHMLDAPLGRDFRGVPYLHSLAAIDKMTLKGSARHSTRQGKAHKNTEANQFEQPIEQFR